MDLYLLCKVFVFYYVKNNFLIAPHLLQKHKIIIFFYIHYIFMYAKYLLERLKPIYNCSE